MEEQKSWTYKGVYVMPASRNSSGIRWCCVGELHLRSDTKAGMRELINDELKKLNKKRI